MLMLDTYSLGKLLEMHFIATTFIKNFVKHDVVTPIITRRNLFFFHPRTLQLLFNLITFQLHLAILNLQAASCTK